MLEGLKASTTYQICIIMSTDASDEDSPQACTTGATAEGAGETGASGAELQIILGAVFGALAFVVILVVVVICCVRRSRKDESFDGGELSKMGASASSRMPQAGYNSKRFSRQKPRDWEVRNAMQNLDIAQAMQNANNRDKELQEKIDGFTADERDRILQMLRQSGGSTLSVVSAASSHRYVPEPPPFRGGAAGGYYPRGASGAYENDVDLTDERPYEEKPHEYEEIPADTYDQIPYDHMYI
jgi:hypothetical protein